MTNPVRGDTNEIEDSSMEAMIAENQQQFGEDDFDVDQVLDGLEEEDGDEEYADDSASSDSVDDSAERLFQGKRIGTDKVLKRLRSNDPEAADLLAGMQRKMSQNSNEWHDLRSDVLQLREQLVNRLENLGGAEKSESAGEEESAGLPPGITEDHLTMFRAMADHFGYVPRDEAERVETERAANEYVSNSMKSAVERYGDRFGTVDADGNVVVNPEVQARLDKRLQDLQDPTKGVTPDDLFRMEFPELAAEGADSSESGRQNPRRSGQRNRRRSNPNVQRRTSGSRGAKVKIYDPDRGDDPNDVLDRSWALGKRELGM